MKTLPELLAEFASYYVDLAASQRADDAATPPPDEEWEWFRDEMLAIEQELDMEDEGLAPDVADAPLPRHVAAALERYR